MSAPTVDRTEAGVPFAAGFRTLEHEVTVDDLPVRGEFPAWLSGTLVRNGPARWEGGRKPYRHWFDGLAMLHRFSFADGQVSYANRYLDTPSYRSVVDKGRIGYGEFGTDPCVSLFGRFFTRLTRPPSANASVNVVPVDGSRMMALTETTMPVEFDADLLETLGVVGYDDAVRGQVTTAHPHVDPTTGDLVNFVVSFGRENAYRVYRQPAGSPARTEVGSFVVRRPGYMHSFAVTERYAVLVEFPLVVNPLALLFRGRPFIENYRWVPEQGTRFIVFDLATGDVRAVCHGPAFFAFHHVNAYDDGPDRVVLDLCAYDDASVVDALYLSKLRANAGVPVPWPRRCELTLTTGGVSTWRLGSEPLELPRVNYGRHNGRSYRWAYGVGFRDGRGDDFINQLVKLDVTTGATAVWTAPGCYPGEPVFVPAPDATAEDDGVLLSAVLDGAAERSFLLVLDARTLGELARAEVPHAIPFGFHGTYVSRR